MDMPASPKRKIQQSLTGVIPFREVARILITGLHTLSGFKVAGQISASVEPAIQLPVFNKGEVRIQPEADRDEVVIEARLPMDDVEKDHEILRAIHRCLDDVQVLGRYAKKDSDHFRHAEWLNFATTTSRPRISASYLLAKQMEKVDGAFLVGGKEVRFPKTDFSTTRLLPEIKVFSGNLTSVDFGMLTGKLLLDSEPAMKVGFSCLNEKVFEEMLEKRFDIRIECHVKIDMLAKQLPQIISLEILRVLPKDPKQLDNQETLC